MSASGDEDHPLSSLRHAREPRVDQPVRPPVAERLELVDQVAHRLAAVEDEHVPHVLEEQHGRPARFEQPEHLGDEAGRLPLDAAGSPGLRQVGARESCRDDVDLRQRPESRTSPTSGTPGKRSARTVLAGSQFSQRSSACPPAGSSPRSMPPMPANRPATVNPAEVPTRSKLHRWNSASRASRPSRPDRYRTVFAHGDGTPGATGLRVPVPLAQHFRFRATSWQRTRRTARTKPGDRVSKSRR